MFPLGGKFELGETYFHRGDDAKEYIFPGSIPEAKLIADEAEEHDCLPPLEALNTEPWVLSGRLTEKLMEALDSFEDANKKKSEGGHYKDGERYWPRAGSGRIHSAAVLL